MEHPAPRLTLLKAITAFGIVSTGLHYTHNFLAVDDYPQASYIDGDGVRLAIVALWPLLTAVGLLGVRLYARGRARAASVCLALYSATGISTLGHFTEGNPDIPAFFYATIFTDGLAGFAVLAFAVWVARSRRPQAGERVVAAPDAAA